MGNRQSSYNDEHNNRLREIDDNLFDILTLLKEDLMEPFAQDAVGSITQWDAVVLYTDIRDTLFRSDIGNPDKEYVIYKIVNTYCNTHILSSQQHAYIRQICDYLSNESIAQNPRK